MLTNRRNVLVLVLLVFILGKANAQSSRILFKTDFGDIKVVLYDFTAKHRDLLLKSIQDSAYQDALFNRVIKGFVVQGGEHDIDIEKRERANPNAIKPRLQPEFDDRAYHKLGALGAGRDDNLEKASFLNQIYFVVGKTVRQGDLDKLELSKGIKFTKEQRDSYLKNGGLPRLDKDYTVFGEIYEGLDVILRISEVQTDNQDYPVKPVPFKLSIIQE